MSSRARSSSTGYADFVQAVVRRLSDRGLTERGVAILRQPLSTHLLGRRIAREYSQEDAQPPDADLLAWSQSAGQGRGEHAWMSPPGGVYVTLIRSLAADAGMQALPLLIAMALCDALNIDLEGRCRLKWPNDLLVDGRKLGGVLIDVASRGPGSGASSSVTTSRVAAAGDAGCLAVISFGVNHGHLDQAGATSLEHEAPGRTVLTELSVRLIGAVDDALDKNLPVADVVDRYRRLSLHRPGDTLRCRLRDEQVKGVFQGFDPHGFLRLRVGEQERLITAGEITDHGE